MIMNALTHLSPAALREAAGIQERILSLQKKLSQILSTPAESAPSEASGRRQISAAGLANIRAAQKARWAKLQGTKPAKKARKKMSAAAKARLSTLAKARWAATKKAGKNRL